MAEQDAGEAGGTRDAARKAMRAGKRERFHQMDDRPAVGGHFLGREAREVVGQLLSFGLWQDATLGFAVIPYDGCCVTPERRLSIPPEVRLAVYSRDGWRCVSCGSAKRLTLDHIFPWILGGSDTEDNLQTLCRSCNCRKGARVLCLCPGCGSIPHSR